MFYSRTLLALSLYTDLRMMLVHCHTSPLPATVAIFNAGAARSSFAHGDT